MDSVPNSRVAKLAALVLYENKKLIEARTYANMYFELEEDKSTEDYRYMLNTFVEIQDEITEQNSKEIFLLWPNKDARRLDSINKLWTTKAMSFAIDIDSIYQLNKHNLAIFSKDDKLGIIDDVGNIVKNAQKYNHFITYDGYILLLDKQTNPTEIYAYNCEIKQGVLLPTVSSFNTKSTDYGKVMLPRANGIIVTYPNNSDMAYVYNIKEESFLVKEELNEFLIKLKKNDIVERFKDEQIFLKDHWLNLGSHLGAGVYELYEADKRFGYINTYNGLFWDVNYYNYLGGFYNGNFELLEGDNRFWLDEDGLRRDTKKNENDSYSGSSKFIKQADGKYRIFQNKNGKDYLILGDNALLNQRQYIEKLLR